ncbi:MAG TPA: RluA family pseudouridine synthase, partial [Candidatus Peregrinibacteria bacterium]|nr:RluA family pseudouridine synthase [Candidatus Peregrinibacteria bacterium]
MTIFTAKFEDSNTRLDSFLAEKTELSRSYLQKLVKEGACLVNQKKKPASYKLKAGDKIKLTLPRKKENQLKAEKIPLKILHEDADLLVVEKPIDMNVHPPSERSKLSGTLVNALLYHCEKLSDLGGPLRPGIVHRLDKDTSGLMMVAKNNSTHEALSKQLKERKVKKTYLTLVSGILDPPSGTINAPLIRNPARRTKMTVSRKKEAREALTHYKLIKAIKKKFSFLEVQIITGRTH